MAKSKAKLVIDDNPVSWYQHSQNLQLKTMNFKKGQSYDVAILGGGFTGLSSALHLSQLGYKVIVIEAKKVGWGASGRNGGHFISGYSCSIETLNKLVGEKNCKKLYQLSVDSVKLISSLIKKHNISCDFTKGYYHAAINRHQAEDIQKTAEDMHKLGHPVDVKVIEQKDIKKHIATERYKALLYDRFSGHLHPLNFVLGLGQAAISAGVDIVENCIVESYDINRTKITIQTSAGELTAKKMVVSGNAYLNGLVSGIEKCIMPVSTYIIATNKLDPKLQKTLIAKNGAVADLNNVLDYYRFSNDGRMLYGGRASYFLHSDGSFAHKTYKKMLKTFPQLADTTIEYAWGGLVAITMNRAPYFGVIDKKIYFATGFSGHGVALCSLAGKLIADKLHKRSSSFDLFTKIKHLPFPGGRLFRAPSLAMAMSYYKFRDYIDQYI